MSHWINSLLDRLPHLTITVFGDFCLDAYWHLDTAAPEISIETGLPVQRVQSQRYSLGGAGNVASNLAAMGTGTIRTVGVLGGHSGEDLFGDKLLSLLAAHNVDTTAMLRDPSIQTMVYAKPYSAAAEHSRIDFGGFNTYSEDLTNRTLAALAHAFATSDAVVINQQVPTSITTPAFIQRLNHIIAAHPNTLCLVDCRHFAEHFTGAILKLNLEEAARVLNTRPLSFSLSFRSKAEESAFVSPTGLQPHHYATQLHTLTTKPVFITRGEQGILAIAADGILHTIPGHTIEGPIDTVGAGDTVVAALTAALAAGESVPHAAQFANLAASITVRQLQTTGTATAAQLRQALT